jgi:hypothetical protein
VASTSNQCTNGEFGCAVGVTKKMSHIAILTTVAKSPFDNEKWQPLESDLLPPNKNSKSCLFSQGRLIDYYYSRTKF